MWSQISLQSPTFVGVWYDTGYSLMFAESTKFKIENFAMHRILSAVYWIYFVFERSIRDYYKTITKKKKTMLVLAKSFFFSNEHNQIFIRNPIHAFHKKKLSYFLFRLFYFYNSPKQIRFRKIQLFHTFTVC